MKYRWGFMDNGVFTECQPKVDDSTSLDFAQQSNEVFYRAKLNGALSFRFEFDYILSKGYNYEHIVVLQYFDNDLNDWGEVWRGRFALTDCEVDYDTQTISVTPETQDRYTKILDGMDTEYNLVKLAPKMQSVNILIRPCMQIYMAGNNKISNFLGGNSWDADSETAEPTQLYNAHWKQLENCAWFYANYTSGIYAGKYAVYYGTFVMADIPGDLYDVSFTFNGRVYNSDGTFVEDQLNGRLHNDLGVRWEFDIRDSSNNSVLSVYYNLITQDYGDNYSAYVEGSMIADSYFRWDRPYGRTICQTDLADITIGGQTYTFYDITNFDIAGNYNYNKYMQYVAAEITPSINTSEDTTGWPESANGRYFIKPQNTATKKYFPIGAETWNSVSYWFNATSTMTTIETQLTAKRTIRDGYELRYAIMKLLVKAGWQGSTFISGILGGSQDYAGYRFLPVITPKSNVITSYYDTPAQKAPITLARILSMLRQAYRIYWFIDDNNNIHCEHISYFDNGNSYSETTPQLSVDLETEIHTNTKSNKVFGQNKIKYDKQDMPEIYEFAWMDKQTMAFDGFQIKCLDTYVNKGAKEDNNIGDFDTDVDYILTSPNDVSKDGFVLFALPYKNGIYSSTLQIETLHVTDENGDEYSLQVQNAEAAFAKIHENMWRYSLPCENINVNNVDTTAKTTGRYKLQTVEFSDLAMKEILKDISNCSKIIRTQQGDGHIKTLSINLNSLAAKADLLFNFVGRWYYLKGTALGNSIVINFNGESVTIEVSANKFIYRYSEPITSLTFGAADVVSVDFADCDGLENLTSCDNMFDGCEELIAVDFDGKTFGAVTSANNMFKGCTELTTLICPDTSSWKADLDFSDCPNLTVDSLYDLIKYLYYYDSGVHTITPNSSMWNNIDGDTQNDLIAKATERGWTIAIPAQYSITGQSAGNTVYATINGSSVEIPVTGGAWSYDYNAAITSFSFAGDNDVTDIDFSVSDGLAGVISLNDAFKNCGGLTTVDFSNCDLSNVVSASDAFANCSALYELIIPADTWLPDIDLSSSVMPKAEMLNVINGLYVYTSGTHTITFNQTIWDAMSVADQQIVFDAASAKGWTTNAVAVVYTIKGTSSNVNGTETFTIQFIDDGAVFPSAAETITCAVDGNGNWGFDYLGKKVYSLQSFSYNNQNILTIDFSAADDFSKLTSLRNAFTSCANITSYNFSGKVLDNVTDAYQCFANNHSLLTNDLSNQTFASLINAQQMFYQCESLPNINLQSAILSNVTTLYYFAMSCTSVQYVDLSAATLDNVTTAYQAFFGCSNVTSIDIKNATFSVLTNASGMFASCGLLANLDLRTATFASTTSIQQFLTSDSALTTLRLDNATFANVTTAQIAFANLFNITAISLPNATFEKLTNALQMFYYCREATSISMPKATFERVTDARNAFNNCNKLTDITLPQNSTAIATNAGTNGNVNISWSPLTYQSMLNVAKWLNDLTGYTAHTCTFKVSAWNALSTAEQNTIDGILSGKNWTRAIA